MGKVGYPILLGSTVAAGHLQTGDSRRATSGCGAAGVAAEALTFTRRLFKRPVYPCSTQRISELLQNRQKLTGGARRRSAHARTHMTKSVSHRPQPGERATQDGGAVSWMIIHSLPDLTGVTPTALRGHRHLTSMLCCCAPSAPVPLPAPRGRGGQAEALGCSPARRPGLRARPLGSGAFGQCAGGQCSLADVWKEEENHSLEEELTL